MAKAAALGMGGCFIQPLIMYWLWPELKPGRAICSALGPLHRAYCRKTASATSASRAAARSGRASAMPPRAIPRSGTDARQSLVRKCEQPRLEGLILEKCAAETSEARRESDHSRTSIVGSVGRTCEIFFRVVTSTTFRPIIHSFSTGADRAACG